MSSDLSVPWGSVNGESPDIPLPRDVDFQTAVHHLDLIAAERRRHGGGTPPPRSTAARKRSGDGDGRGLKLKVDLVLYTSAESDKSQRAMRTVQHVLSQYDGRQVRFSMCDLSQQPMEGEADAVVFTPTLVKKGPGPRMSIIGNLEHEDVLRELLETCGVERCRWDD